MDVLNLKKEQIKLSKKVITKDDFEEIKYIAGCDQTVIGSDILASVAVVDVSTLEVVERKYAVAHAPINYIPGFLGYREGPAIIEAVNKLETKPDVLLIDGNGILHPRRFGIASQVGLSLDIPTIGLSKTLIVGEIHSRNILIAGHKTGILIETKEHARPIYLSTGHRIGLKSAEDIVKLCLVKKHKMPEPIHEAHKYTKKIKKKIEERLSKEVLQTKEIILEQG